MLKLLSELDIQTRYLTTALVDLIRMIKEYYKIPPILLIDEYDQPIMSSYEYDYHEELGAFFAIFMEQH